MALLSDGTTISIDGAKIGEVRDIRVGGGGYGAIDVRHLETIGLAPFLQSTAKDGGEISVDYIASTVLNIAAGLHSATITRSDSSSAPFACFVLDDSEAFSVGREITRTIRFKVTVAT